MRRIVQLVLLTFILTVSTRLDASHILGGQMTYECQSLNSDGTFTMSVNLTLFGDSASSVDPNDPNERIGIYTGDNGVDWTYLKKFGLPTAVVTKVDNQDSAPCVDIRGYFTKISYTFDVTLPVSSKSYLISYTRCCRVDGLKNIIDSGNEGARYYIEITPEAQKVCDTSPIFDTSPPIFACVKKNFDYKYTAIDKDGDSIVYEMCKPSAGGGPEGSRGYGDPFSCQGIYTDPARCGQQILDLPYKNGYSFDNPINGDTPISIDRTTGEISGHNGNIREQYAMAICATSYRNGKKLTTVKSDFQVSVINCVKAVKAGLLDNGVQVLDIQKCDGKTINLESAPFRDLGFPPTYDWTFNLPDGTQITSQDENPTITFPDYGSYSGTLEINKDNQYENCRDKADIVVNAYPAVDADFDIVYDPCVNTPVSLKNKSVTPFSNVDTYEWYLNGTLISNNRDDQYSITVPGSQEFELKITDENDCVDSFSESFDYYPVPANFVIDYGSGYRCAPVYIKPSPLGTIIDASYDIQWNINGQKYSGLNPTLYLENHGKYDVQVDITSPSSGCSPVSKTDQIEILKKPIANFTYTPSLVTQINNEVQFNDESIDGDTFEWYIENNSNLFTSDPLVTFQDTGVHEIKQVVISSNTCRDTLSTTIDVVPITTFYMPNAFTPNGDGTNDEFKGKGLTENIISYEMIIFNRWGEKIFQTKDFDQGWDGKMPNANLAPSETYTYVVKIVGVRDQEKELKGSLLLIR